MAAASDDPEEMEFLERADVAAIHFTGINQ